LSDRNSLPILVIGRNRPLHLKNILESLARTGSECIYIFLDGPNVESSSRDETIITSDLFLTQKVAQDFQKEHPNRLNISPIKLGCYVGVTSAINWFFSHVEYGLIFEDDLDFHPAIIEIAKKALADFKDNEDIMSVSFYRDSGINPDGAFIKTTFPSSWGWATWKHKWSKFDHDSHKKIAKKPLVLFKRGGISGFRRWIYVINRLRKNELDSWAYRWMFTLWLEKKYSVVPPFNMIENRGFDDLATHTKKGISAKFDLNYEIRDIHWSQPIYLDEDYERRLLLNRFGVS
jgi:hypothetical protein